MEKIILITMMVVLCNVSFAGRYLSDEEMDSRFYENKKEESTNVHVDMYRSRMKTNIQKRKFDGETYEDLMKDTKESLIDSGEFMIQDNYEEVVGSIFENAFGG